MPQLQKKITACFCIISLLFLLCGCGSSSKQEGNELVSIPVLAGTDVESAKIVLAGKGLIPIVQKVEDEQIEAGIVIRTEPAAGEKISPDSSVIIIASSGSAPKMPDLTYKSEDFAVRTLEDMGLTVKTEYEYNDDVIDGTIIRTSPAKNSSLKCKDTVTIYVSLGSEWVYSENSYMSWINQGNRADIWEFSNPYRDANTMYLDCYAVTIYKSFEWQDRYEHGYGNGIACLNDTFDKTVPVKIRYDNVAVKSGEPFSIIIEIPLKELNTTNPTDLHLRLYTCKNHTDTNPQSINLDLTISW